MKTIIAGSRDITDYNTVAMAIKNSGFKITEVVSGQARGVDTVGEVWAKSNGIPIKTFKPNWDDITADGAVVKTNKYGKKYNAMAGFQRNQEMADYADALIAIWKAKSSGTGDMIERARKAGLKVYIKEI